MAFNKFFKNKGNSPDGFKNYLEPEFDRDYYHVNTLSYYYDKMANMDKKYRDEVKILTNSFKDIKEWTEGIGLRKQTKFILEQWLDDGIFEEIVNEEIFGHKADQSDLDYLYNRVQDIQIDVTNPPKPLTPIKFSGQDETDELQAIFDYAFDNNIFNVVIPKGTIMIKGDKYFINHIQKDKHIRRKCGVRTRPNTTYTFQEGSTLKTIPTNAEGYSLIAIFESDNVTINGGYFVGEKIEHDYSISSSHEWGYGIYIQNSQYIVIDGVETNEQLGDGIFISNDEGFKYIKIKNCVLRNAKRHELTIIKGSNITLLNNRFTKKDKEKDGLTNSSYGGLNIDIEGHSNGDIMDDLYVDGNYFENYVNVNFRVESLQSNNNITITNNVFKRGDSPSGASGGSVNLHTVKNTVFTGNHVIYESEYGYEGLLLTISQGSKQVVASNNTFQGATPFAVRDSTHVTLTSNIGIGIDRAFSISNVDLAIISDNTFDDVNRYSSPSNLTNSTISNNIFNCNLTPDLPFYLFSFSNLMNVRIVNNLFKFTTVYPNYAFAVTSVEDGFNLIKDNIIDGYKVEKINFGADPDRFYGSNENYGIKK